jgi:hypothetical protein
LLVLTGPAGAGKTATIRVLSRELKFDIIEWQNALDDVFNEEDYGDQGLIFLGNYELTPYRITFAEIPDIHESRF